MNYRRIGYQERSFLDEIEIPADARSFISKMNRLIDPDVSAFLGAEEGKLALGSLNRTLIEGDKKILLMMALYTPRGRKDLQEVFIRMTTRCDEFGISEIRVSPDLNSRKTEFLFLGFTESEWGLCYYL